MSIHDGTWVADARAGTLARSFMPWRMVPGTRNYHAFDVVITGDNPVLAAILLRRASDRGLDAAVTLPCAPDAWPYDLAASAQGEALLNSALELSPTFGFGPTLLSRILAGSRGSLLPSGAFYLSVKHPDGEVALYPTAPAKNTLPAAQADFSSAFRQATKDFAVAWFLPDRKTAVFAKRLILTAMPATFCNSHVVPGESGRDISWEHPLVAAVGTASAEGRTGVTAAKMLVEDVVRCARSVPLEGLRPS